MTYAEEQERVRRDDAGRRVLSLRADARGRDVVKVARVVRADLESLERLGYEVKGLEIRGHLLRRKRSTH